MACIVSPQAVAGRERRKAGCDWKCSPQLLHMQTSKITILTLFFWEWLPVRTIWLSDVYETCNVSTVCRLEGPSWLFITDPFLRRLLVITNLPSNRETPRMPWHPAVSYLFTLETLENCWLCGICSDTRLEKTEGKGKQKRTILSRS